MKNGEVRHPDIWASSIPEPPENNYSYIDPRSLNEDSSFSDDHDYHLSEETCGNPAYMTTQQANFLATFQNQKNTSNTFKLVKDPKYALKVEKL